MCSLTAFTGTVATATVPANQLNVTVATGGTLRPGLVMPAGIFGAGTIIASQLSGTPGGAGVYQLSQSFRPPASFTLTVNGDGASQVPSADGGCWIGQFTSDTFVTQFGAICDGTADDTAAMNAALVAGALGPQFVAVPPGKTCKSTAGITVPAGVTLLGYGIAAGNPPVGTTITCPANTVTNCVQLTAGGGGLGAAQVRDLSIVGTGTPTSGATGLLFNNGYGMRASNVIVSHFDTCARWLANAPGGLDFLGVGLNVAECKTHYLEFDGWAEAKIYGGRIGEDNTGDFAAADFVHYTGTVCNGAGCGPNTISFFGTQFNPGSAVAPSCFFNWSSWNGNGAVTEFRFIGVHAEVADAAHANPYFCTDSTITALDSLFVADSTIQNDLAPTSAVFSINSATQLRNWHVHDVTLVGGVTLAPTPTGGVPAFSQVFFDKITNATPWSLTSNGATNTGNQLTINNSYIGNLTIAGKWDIGLSLLGDAIGTVTDTASGSVFMNEPYQPWNPSVTFGGGAAGWAETNSGFYRRLPDGGMDVTYNIAINTVGSATGAAAINGLPKTCGVPTLATPQAATLANLAASLTNGPAFVEINGSNGAQLLPFQWGTGGWASLTNTQFAANTVVFQGAVQCPLVQ